MHWSFIPATLLNSFTTSNNFFSRCLRKKSCHLQIEFYFFPIQMSFISFSCLFPLARISIRGMLNRSGTNSHPCLVPDLGKKLSFYHHWVWCDLWGFRRCPLLDWKSFGVYQTLFLCLLWWSCGFCPLLI